MFVSLAVLGALLVPAAAGPPPRATAIFAGGCFWSMEHAFDGVPGVESVTVGYAGGRVDHPTYLQVGSGTTGHLESVEVSYDPTRTDYERLLDVYWHNIDPFDPDGQFCDHGPEYHTAIFYRSDDERRIAERSRRSLEESFHRS